MNKDGRPVMGQAVPHESAHLHVAGTAPYTDDLPEVTGTLHAALGLSPVAHGRLCSIDLDRLRAQPGVVAVLTSLDIPGTNDCGAILADEPILVPLAQAGEGPPDGGPEGGPEDRVEGSLQGNFEGELRYLGQPVFVVIARTREAARRAAALASQVLTVQALPAQLDPLAAAQAGQTVVPVMRLVRESAPGATTAAIDTAPHRLEGRMTLGGQEQFYLEGQISYALPGEDRSVLVHCSTQHPSEMQHLVARALGWSSNQVQVQCRRMGGGFGGKESQSAPFACIAALAAVKLGRPVKLRLDRDDDFMITGRRHCFWTDFDVGFDGDGRIRGVTARMVSRAGHSADLSAPVMTRALCHFDNAYWLPEVRLEGHCARTNTQSNTAFRGFGGPQGAMAIELILDRIARHQGLDPLDVRKANLYARHPDDGSGQGWETPYGQPVQPNNLHELIESLELRAAYRERRREITDWNARSPVLRRGIALTPVKFGIAFNVKHFNQAGALVHVYTDGSVLVNHGGTEMGQGLNTKVAQVVAHTLGIRLDRVRCTPTDTQKIANTSATAASTGSDLNGKAAEQAALRIRDRLAGLAARLLGGEMLGGEIQDVRFENDAVHVAGQNMGFEALVQKAYMERLQLWSDGFYATPDLSWDRDAMRGRPFHYFASGAAVSEVVVDILTGEHRLLRADLLQDVGQSLNPALDRGQIEGAFMQGVGWLMTEELVWHPTTGQLLTHAPSTYKIPTATDCPPVFNVHLWDRPNAVDTVGRSKAVGEPPLLLAFSAWMALRDAIASTGGPNADPPLTAPATPEAVLRALERHGIEPASLSV
jgi:xanthine dehydrogenase large subunit